MARGKRSTKRQRKEEGSPQKSSPSKRVKTGEQTEAPAPEKAEEKKSANPDSFPIFDGKVMHLCI